ncbi:hypothetical protein PLESTB_001768700 [Pleodorina starrii]|uniref:non-specific serine/threonine protein kinase n=1 Tax=Pleodorina starrii TaxID=330485 RepID=A0A9W6C140_9CHLO|nr:hypothetical protein PLESTM_001864000 [Pleodorina starrii]GLC61550.1 hypothetical protein PLESTB_001768700 [Pleodorina starrii]GLC76829.1 hypothetical protein PLESTF_001845600 [Pleodorina starrii]
MLKGATKLPVQVQKRRKARKKALAATTQDSREKSHAEESLSSGEEDYSDSDDEGTEDYKKGGYHPVSVGEKYKSGRYTVLRKLGWGHFSTVWLVHDAESGDYRALKVQKSAQHYTEAARDEITLLSQLRDGDQNNEKHCVRLCDSFEHSGPNGRHVCLVFEVLGDNLLALIKRYDYKGIPIPIVRNLARQMLVALDYMHRCCEIIHTDFKPENVMLMEPLRDRTWVIPQPTEQPNASQAARSAPAAPAAAPTAPANGAEGLTRNQKKKLKKKLKKAAAKKTDQAESVAGDAEGDDDGSDVEESTSGVTGQTSSDTGAAGDVATSGGAVDAGVLAPAECGPPVVENGDADRLASGADTTTSGAGEGPQPLVITCPGLTDEQLRTAACKVVDFGNACWTYKQFTTDVQTRQYRCPEVILGAKYSTPADMWSFACVVFELVTGDLLFDPRSGDKWDRDEDHLALFIELLGRMPRKVYEKGKYSRDYFNRNGELRHIKKLRFWPLDRVLVEKYKLSEEEAAGLASFMLPMLRFVPEERATAAEMLNHPWLRGELPPQAQEDTAVRSDKRNGSAGSGSQRSVSPEERERRHSSRYTPGGGAALGSRERHITGTRAYSRSRSRSRSHHHAERRYGSRSSRSRSRGKVADWRREYRPEREHRPDRGYHRRDSLERDAERYRGYRR